MGLLSCGFCAAWLALYLLPLQLLSSEQAPLPCLAQFHISCAHRYGNYGSQRPSKRPSAGVPLSKLSLLLKQFLRYFTVTFVLEEVAFRGALDSHIYQPPTDGQRRGGSAWLSAIFVSALWGIWHLPLLPTGGAAAFAAAIPMVIIVHTLTGVPLSFCWRAGGTLV